MENILGIKSMVLGPSSWQMEVSTLDSGFEENNTATESLSLVVELSRGANGFRGNSNLILNLVPS